jgi:hypothetical protein
VATTLLTKEGDITVKKLLVLALFLAAMLPVSAVAADNLAQFQGGIGVIPVSSAPGPALVAETVNRNIVRGVQPPGQPWVIADLHADVKVDGQINVVGRGLLLAGGNGVGTGGSGGSPTASNQSVFATLICEAASPFTERNTTLTGVQLDDNGDFRIDDMLTPAPPAPADCTKPVLLIRNTAGAWFAAGIPK